jgi:hypothetical protein
MQQEPRQPICLELSADEALVFFEFLSRFSESDQLTIEDQSEEQILWKLCGGLEKRLSEPLTPQYSELLAKARRRIRGDSSTPGA